MHYVHKPRPALPNPPSGQKELQDQKQFVFHVVFFYNAVNELYVYETNWNTSCDKSLWNKK